MPSWKKVIVSGSSAAIPSITHTGDFTLDVSGDITLSAGLTSAEGMDSDTMGTKGTTGDSKDISEAGISYAVASGVTANLGWKSTDSNDEGASETSGGTSWYIGANMSF